jgi:hypothetical protein
MMGNLRSLTTTQRYCCETPQRPNEQCAMNHEQLQENSLPLQGVVVQSFAWQIPNTEV